MAPMRELDLVDLGLVHVQVRDAARIARELARITGNAIIEARAHRDQEIAIVHRVVGKGGAVHAQHAHRQRIGGIERADAHQRGHDGNAERMGKPGQLARRPGIDHPAAGVDQRPFRGGQQLEEVRRLRLPERACGQLAQTGAVAWNRQSTLTSEHHVRVLYILRNVDHHRAGPAGARDLEGGAHRRFQSRRVSHQEHVLGDRAHEGRDRCFLEGIRTDRSARDLTTDHHDRHRVRHAVADRRHRIGGARTRGHETHTHLTAGAGIARGHKTRTLLIGGHDQRHLDAAGALLLLVEGEDRVVGREDGAAAVAKDGPDALVRQDLDDRLRPRHGRAGQGVCR